MSSFSKLNSHFIMRCGLSLMMIVVVACFTSFASAAGTATKTKTSSGTVTFSETEPETSTLTFSRTESETDSLPTVTFSETEPETSTLTFSRTESETDSLPKTPSRTATHRTPTITFSMTENETDSQQKTKSKTISRHTASKSSSGTETLTSSQPRTPTLSRTHFLECSGSDPFNRKLSLIDTTFDMDTNYHFANIDNCHITVSGGSVGVNTNFTFADMINGSVIITDLVMTTWLTSDAGAGSVASAFTFGTLTNIDKVQLSNITWNLLGWQSQASWLQKVAVRHTKALINVTTYIVRDVWFGGFASIVSTASTSLVAAVLFASSVDGLASSQQKHTMLFSNITVSGTLVKGYFGVTASLVIFSDATKTIRNMGGSLSVTGAGGGEGGGDKNSLLNVQRVLSTAGFATFVPVLVSQMLTSISGGFEVSNVVAKASNVTCASSCYVGAVKWERPVSSISGSGINCTGITVVVSEIRNAAASVECITFRFADAVTQVAKMLFHDVTVSVPHMHAATYVHFHAALFSQPVNNVDVLSFDGIEASSSLIAVGGSAGAAVTCIVVRFADSTAGIYSVRNVMFLNIRADIERITLNNYAYYIGIAKFGGDVWHVELLLLRNVSLLGETRELQSTSNGGLSSSCLVLSSGTAGGWINVTSTVIQDATVLVAGPMQASRGKAVMGAFFMGRSLTGTYVYVGAVATPASTITLQNIVLSGALSGDTGIDVFGARFDLVSYVKHFLVQNTTLDVACAEPVRTPTAWPPNALAAPATILVTALDFTYAWSTSSQFKSMYNITLSDVSITNSRAAQEGNSAANLQSTGDILIVGFRMYSFSVYYVQTIFFSGVSIDFARGSIGTPSSPSLSLVAPSGVKVAVATFGFFVQECGNVTVSKSSIRANNITSSFAPVEVGLLSFLNQVINVSSISVLYSTVSLDSLTSSSSTIDVAALVRFKSIAKLVATVNITDNAVVISSATSSNSAGDVIVTGVHFLSGGGTSNDNFVTNAFVASQNTFNVSRASVAAFRTLNCSFVKINVLYTRFNVSGNATFSIDQLAMHISSSSGSYTKAISGVLDIGSGGLAPENTATFSALHITNCSVSAEVVAGPAGPTTPIWATMAFTVLRSDQNSFVAAKFYVVNCSLSVAPVVHSGAWTNKLAAHLIDVSAGPLPFLPTTFSSWAFQHELNMSTLRLHSCGGGGLVSTTGLSGAALWVQRSSPPSAPAAIVNATIFNNTFVSEASCASVCNRSTCSLHRFESGSFVRGTYSFSQNLVQSNSPAAGIAVFAVLPGAFVADGGGARIIIENNTARNERYPIGMRPLPGTSFYQLAGSSWFFLCNDLLRYYVTKTISDVLTQSPPSGVTSIVDSCASPTRSRTSSRSRTPSHSKSVTQSGVTDTTLTDSDNTRSISTPSLVHNFSATQNTTLSYNGTATLPNDNAGGTATPNSTASSTRTPSRTAERRTSSNNESTLSDESLSLSAGSVTLPTVSGSRTLNGSSFTVPVTATPSDSRELSLSPTLVIKKPFALAVPVSEELQETALYFGAVSGAANVALVQQLQRSGALLRIVRCGKDAHLPLSAAQSPTGMTIGSDWLKYHRGAVLGNSIIGFTMTALYALALPILMKIKKMTYEEAILKLRFPSYIIVPLSIIAAPTCISGAVLFWYGNGAADVMLMVFLGLFLPFAPFAFLIGFFYAAKAKRLPLYTVKTQQREKGTETLKTKFLHWWYWAVRPTKRWPEQHPFVIRYFPLMYPARYGWFPAFDWMTTMSVSFLAGLATSITAKVSTCIAVSITTLIVLCAYMVVQLYYRPTLARLASGIQIILTSFSILNALLATLLLVGMSVGDGMTGLASVENGVALVGGVLTAIDLGIEFYETLGKANEDEANKKKKQDDGEAAEMKELEDNPDNKEVPLLEGGAGVLKVPSLVQKAFGGKKTNNNLLKAAAMMKQQQQQQQGGSDDASSIIIPVVAAASTTDDNNNQQEPQQRTRGASLAKFRKAANMNIIGNRVQNPFLIGKPESAATGKFIQASNFGDDLLVELQDDIEGQIAEAEKDFWNDIEQGPTSAAAADADGSNDDFDSAFAADFGDNDDYYNNNDGAAEAAANLHSQDSFHIDGGEYQLGDDDIGGGGGLWDGVDARQRYATRQGNHNTRIADLDDDAGPRRADAELYETVRVTDGSNNRVDADGAGDEGEDLMYRRNELEGLFGGANSSSGGSSGRRKKNDYEQI